MKRRCRKERYLETNLFEILKYPITVGIFAQISNLFSDNFKYPLLYIFLCGIYNKGVPYLSDLFLHSQEEYIYLTDRQKLALLTQIIRENLTLKQIERYAESVDVQWV
ncbi:hypothetical protein K7X08_017841 [Anisodus acutangulus]|uniref:Uncharacterized protein n=1 Tax=Anisodus acutangulus TaxID=402998 RepID=A0A9Q1LUJ7_9SOLA|nr:hypothetical protein K7X08_017841 [Anisodus acutangulus]